MELHAEDAAALHRRGERAPIIGARDLVRRRGRGVRVDEVVDAIADQCSGGLQPAQGRLKPAPTRRDAIPSDLRHWQHAVVPYDLAANEAEAARGAHLVRDVEEE